MASVRTFTLPHYDDYAVHVALFKDVTNAAFLRSQLLEANPDFDYAFLDASMILSPTHLLTATFLTLHALLSTPPKAKTRTPHSELVFRLSPNNNIGESYRVFGISDASTSIIAVKLGVTADGKVAESVSHESVSRHLGDVVEGTSVEIEGEGEVLGSFVDLGRLRKVYKLGAQQKKGSANGVGSGSGSAAKDETKEMESVILGLMSLKGS